MIRHVRYGLPVAIGGAAELVLAHTATAPAAGLARKAIAVLAMLVVASMTLSAVRPL